MAVTVTVAEPAADATAAVLHDLPAGGLVEEPAGRGTVRLRVYLPRDVATESLLQTLRRRLDRLTSHPIDIAGVADRAWESAWKEHYHAFPVGRRFWISPSWEAAPAPPGRLAIRLDPGMAFGTGLHASTQLCIELLEHALRPGQRVIDLGTGSGILAIAAARLGAGRVVAIDSDPVAVEAAERNCRENLVADRVRVVCRDGIGGATGMRKADLVLANLTAALLRTHLPAIASRLAPGGAVAASGIVESQQAGVDRALAKARLQTIRRVQAGEWIGLLAAGAAGR